MSRLTQASLAQFCGSEHMFRHWAGRLHFTDGIKFLAEEGGAYWLIDAIASYQGEKCITGNPMLRNFQFWELHVMDGSAVLTCVADRGEPPAVVQSIEFTDFPLAQVKIYVERGAVRDSRGRIVPTMVAMLPSER